MAKKIIENQQLMSDVREAINDNFTELYDQVGTGGSSTFAALTDTPTELTADKYLKVNTEGTALELVDAPVGSGGGSGEGANTAEIQAHQGLFEGVVPFAISALPSNGAGRKILYLDHYGAGESSEDYFLYSNHLDSSRFAVYFKTNTVTGEWDTSITITKEGDGSLASYIANGHAFYFGGGSSNGSSSGGSSNFYGANIFLTQGTLAIKSQTSDFIESITMVGNTNNYDITFKDGIFTEPPIMVSTAVNTSDNYLEGVLVKSDASSGDLYASGKKMTIRWELTSEVRSYLTTATDFHGANLIFMKTGADFDASSSSGGSSGGGSSTFAALTDTPTELTADKYLKVNTEGTALELVDAPVGGSSLSGGIGSLSIIKQKAGDFYTDIPDAIVGALENGANCILRLKFNGLGLMHYEARHEANADNDFVMSFNTDLDGSYTAPLHTGSFYPWLADRSMDQNLRWFIENGRALYSGGSSSSSGGPSTNNVVSAIIEADGTITSSSDDWIESIEVGNGYMTINFVSNYFTQTPSIATSIDHQDGVSHMNIEYQALTKDTVQIIQRGLTNLNYTTLGQLTIMAQHQDRISGSSSSGGSSTGGIKTWCVFDGTGTDNTEMTIKAGANVASVLKISNGIYKVTMTNPMPSEHYSVSVDCNPWGTQGAYGGVMYEYSGDTSKNPTTTTFYIDCRSGGGQYGSPNRVTFHVVC